MSLGPVVLRTSTFTVALKFFDFLRSILRESANYNGQTERGPGTEAGQEKVSFDALKGQNIGVR